MAVAELYRLYVQLSTKIMVEGKYLTVQQMYFEMIQSKIVDTPIQLTMDTNSSDKC